MYLYLDAPQHRIQLSSTALGIWHLASILTALTPPTSPAPATERFVAWWCRRLRWAHAAMWCLASRARSRRPFQRLLEGACRPPWLHVGQLRQPPSRES